MEAGSKKIIANIAWLFLDKAIHMTVGLVVGVWVTRYLGPEQFGLLSYAQAYVTLFSAVASMGLDGIVVRNIVRDPGRAGVILGSAFILKIAGGVFALFLATGTIWIFYPEDMLTRWLVGIIAAGAIFHAFDTIDFWFQANVSSKYTVYAKSLSFLLISTLKIFLIIGNAPLIAFAWAGLAEVVIGAMGMVAAYRARGYRITGWRVSAVVGRDLIRDSWPMILSGLVVMVYMRVDQIMLGGMIGPEAVGIYAAATRISEIWYFIPTAIITSVFPSIIKARQVSEALYNRRLQVLFNLMVGLAYAITLPMTFMSDWVVSLLYGNDFLESGPVLSIHIWASVFVFLQISTGSWYINENLHVEAFLRYLTGAVLNIVLNLFLIPVFGAKGAAIATICSFAVVVLLPAVFSGPYRKIFPAILRAIFLKWV
ncbi:MAG: flippase [Firmicutes bacterium]|nr:flippase [Bacillota bacterium]